MKGSLYGFVLDGAIPESEPLVTQLNSWFTCLLATVPARSKCTAIFFEDFSDLGTLSQFTFSENLLQVPRLFCCGATSGSVSLVASLSKVLCAMQRTGIEGKRQISIFHSSANAQPFDLLLGNRLISIAFHSVRLEVVLNVVFFGSADGAQAARSTSVLKQLAEITGGLFLPVPADNLASVLLFGTAQVDERAKVKRAGSVEYGTVCSCHGNQIRQGNLCCTCLAVYCRFVPVCRVCKTKFRF